MNALRIILRIPTKLPTTHPTGSRELNPNVAGSYEIVLYSKAEKDLEKVPNPDFSKVDKAILSLRSNPRPFGSKKLDPYLWRVRVGEWRIVYAIDDEKCKVVILHVRRRNEKTYKNL